MFDYGVTLANTTMIMIMVNVLLNHKMDGLERMLGYRHAGLQRFHCNND